MADIKFETAAPAQGLLSGVQSGLNAGMLIQQEKRLQATAKLQQEAAAREEAKNKMTGALELMKQSWVPQDYKLMLYQQNVMPYFSGSKIQLPELNNWPDFGDKAAKELQDIITKGSKAGLPAAEIETMASLALMRYEKDFRDAGKPVLDSLRARAENESEMEKAKLERQKPPSGYRWTADGNLEPIPGGPGKTDETKKAETAQGRVSTAVESLKGYYQELKELGAIVDVKDSSLANMWRRLAASGPGQATANTFGTKAQSVRNSIYQMRPILIQEIRKATEMGARGLDSAKELEFYLQAATDPKRDLQANIKALDVLDKAYGLGLNVSPGSGSSKPKTVTQNGVTYTWNEKTGKYE